MKRTIDFIGNVIGTTALLLVWGLFFYHITNDYFFVFGKFRDFSIVGWIVILGVWGLALYKFSKKKYMLFAYAVCLSLIAVALDCYRLVLYASDEDAKVYLFALMVIESLIIAEAIGVKGMYHLSILGISCFIITYFGALVLYPVFISVRTLGIISVVITGLYLLMKYLLLHHKNYAARLFYRGLIAATGVFLFVIALFVYDKTTFGIRFYEKPVETAIENPKVSIVVPVYNAENTLEHTLYSLRHQSLRDIEIIAVDDGSTDDSAKILDKYAAFDKRIKVIHQENAYVGAARNRGMREAKGKYIGFVDADDWVSLNFYEELYQAAEQQKVDIATAQIILRVHDYYGLKSEKYDAKQRYEYMTVIEDLAEYRENIFGYPVDKIYRRDFLEKNNILFTTLRTNAEDNYFTTQALMYADKMAVAAETIYYYLQNYGSLSVVRHVSAQDKVVEMFVELDKLLENTDFDEEKKSRWHEVIKAVRRVCFNTFFKWLKYEDEAVGKQRIRTYFPDDDIDFEGLTAEKKETKVSVIVPVYNGEKKLSRTLDNLLAQTLEEIEIIVVDDGSTDKTAEIINKYVAENPQIRGIHQKNAYVGAARNNGFKVAQGEYVAFLDADDTVSEDFYEKLYKTAKRHDADVVAADHVVSVWVNENKEELYMERQAFTDKGIVEDLSAYRAEIYGYLWDKLYRKDFLNKHHILGTPRRTPAEDNYFTTQVLMYADKMYVAKGTTHYYWRGETSETGVKYTNPKDEIIEMFADLNNLIEESELSDEQKNVWLDAVAQVRVKLFANYYDCLKEEDKEAVRAKIRQYFINDEIENVLLPANDNQKKHQLYQKVG